jgi:hypothetical protein
MSKSVLIKPGIAFLPLPTDDYPKTHPHFVISKVVSGKVLVVNITDRKNIESTCYIDAGEHESVTKPSAVYYRLCSEHDAEKMSHALAKGVGVRLLNDLSTELLARVVAGAASSKDIKGSTKIKYGLKSKEHTSDPPF